MWDRICIEWWWWVLYSDLPHKKSILEAPFCIKIYSTGNNPCFKSILFFHSLNINSDYEMILQFKGNSRFPYEMCFNFFFLGWIFFFRELFFLKSNKSKRPATKYFNFFVPSCLLFYMFWVEFCFSVDEGEVLRPTDCLILSDVCETELIILWSRNYWFYQIFVQSTVD
jgi:hypothetical protein